MGGLKRTALSLLLGIDQNASEMFWGRWSPDGAHWSQIGSSVGSQDSGALSVHWVSVASVNHRSAISAKSITSGPQSALSFNSYRSKQE
jgi:hypothetical protein